MLADIRTGVVFLFYFRKYPKTCDDLFICPWLFPSWFEWMRFATVTSGMSSSQTTSGHFKLRSQSDFVVILFVCLWEAERELFNFMHKQYAYIDDSTFLCTTGCLKKCKVTTYVHLLNTRCLFKGSCLIFRPNFVVKIINCRLATVTTVSKVKSEGKTVLLAM